ncbi:ClpXP adapter SpxH family protein [Bacillus sp. FJAT-50079]|uniref:ClpXP adapter SpxH family protein n=1 Tax=Bacillus sp. FJAT-50079 TaxID=2833577 RepID=UPI001BCA37DC|nr:ClpXP adapter SpxH family protein [Bacillus sp. FJAT-50079]MBS4207956.1 DsbA family protein [Bacillus sp. FJAT-50079]
MNEWSANIENSYKINSKPLEIYFFIDPFCSDCWSLSPLLKKLQLEYGDYFTIKYVLCGQLSALNCKSKPDIPHFLQNKKCQEWKGISLQFSFTDEDAFTPHLAAISIKAAELQGKNAGIRFIQRLQELFFIENANITDINILRQCAKYVGLDLEEFTKDIYSTSAARAFQCDLKISAEMEVTEMPAMVFFNENIEDEGLKITGIYSYSIYVQILTEILEEYPKPAEIPPLEMFLKENPINETNDLALIYDKPVKHIERQMKKLQLQQKAKKIPAQSGNFWQYDPS